MREINWDSFNSVGAFVHDWANATFPGRPPKASLTKLVMEEIPELLTHLKEKGHKGIGEELADCFILLLDLAEMWGVDLPEALERKMALNEQRVWVKDPDTGHYNHKVMVSHDPAGRDHGCTVVAEPTKDGKIKITEVDYEKVTAERYFGVKDDER